VVAEADLEDGAFLLRAGKKKFHRVTVPIDCGRFQCNVGWVESSRPTTLVGLEDSTTLQPDRVCLLKGVYA